MLVSELGDGMKEIFINDRSKQTIFSDEHYCIVKVADSLYEIYIDGIKIKGRLSLSPEASCNKCMYKNNDCKFYYYNNGKSCFDTICYLIEKDALPIGWQHCWVEE
jgi:hypothetical protein